LPLPKVLRPCPQRLFLKDREAQANVWTECHRTCRPRLGEIPTTESRRMFGSWRTCRPATSHPACARNCACTGSDACLDRGREQGVPRTTGRRHRTRLSRTNARRSLAAYHDCRFLNQRTVAEGMRLVEVVSLCTGGFRGVSGPLRLAWPSIIGMCGAVRQVDAATAEFNEELHVPSLEPHGVSTAKKSTAMMMLACVRRNSRHDDPRWTVGPSSSRLRIFLTSLPRPRRWGPSARRRCADSPTADSPRQAARSIVERPPWSVVDPAVAYRSNLSLWGAGANGGASRATTNADKLVRGNSAADRNTRSAARYAGRRTWRPVVLTGGGGRPISRSFDAVDWNRRTRSCRMRCNAT